MTTTASIVQIDVRDITPRERHPRIMAAFGALAAGDALDIVSDHEPKGLQFQFDVELPGQFSWDVVEAGPQVWRVRIGRVAKPQGNRCCGACGCG
jgi:uncharacterized protein (DUF2249 family)